MLRVYSTREKKTCTRGDCYRFDTPSSADIRLENMEIQDERSAEMPDGPGIGLATCGTRSRERKNRVQGQYFYFYFFSTGYAYARKRHLSHILAL
jgi:hypothetical protein